jgi:protein-tyrosine phosphatase
MNPKRFIVPGPWTGQLAISTRPRGGDWLEDEVRGWRTAGVDVVVSLLEPVEDHELDLDRESRVVKEQGIRFVSFPVPDRGVPQSLNETVTLLGELRGALEQGRSVVVHCRQGIGRSSLIAAGLLVAAGADPNDAFDRVGAARGTSVPDTPEQRAWLGRVLADRLVPARG